MNDIYDSNDKSLWNNKYAPERATDLIGNNFIIKSLREWLQKWESNNKSQDKIKSDKKESLKKSRLQYKKQNSNKKAVLLNGPPGIGKTSSALIICKELGFHTVEVNASDTRCKAELNLKNGMQCNKANFIKESI